jgi:probable F420-dependent oxidoreductase
MRFGTLIPHFGGYATRDAIIRESRRAEDLGFDALWVRDHLVWEPHGIEGSDKTFIDPFEVLSAAAAVTDRINLGTAVVIPTRWPLKLAQECAGLSFLSGGRLTVGIGLGFNPKEFAAVGLRAEDREQIFEETIEILRAAWAPGAITHDGTLFQIDKVEIEPKPVAPIPIVYGGSTPAAVRRAVSKTDGWHCGRLPIATLDARLAQIKGLAAGRKVETIVQPLVVVAENLDAAASRVPMELLLASSEGSRFWVRPEGREFRTLDDLKGLVLFGSPQDIVNQAKELMERQIDELVFDLRLQFDDYSSVLKLIGQEVLPALREVDSSATSSFSREPVPQNAAGI